MTLSLHTLKPARGAKRRSKRIGRGNASGHGTYSTRGQKGQRARSGGRKGLKLMGARRLIMSAPKVRGFRSLRPRLVVVNIFDLERVMKSGDMVTPAKLAAAGLVADGSGKMKILGDGTLTKPLTIRGLLVSQPAREKILAAGGAIE